MPGPFDAGAMLSEAKKNALQFVSGAVQTFGPGGTLTDAQYQANMAALRKGQKQPYKSEGQVPLIEPTLTGIYGLGKLVTDHLPFDYTLSIPAADRSLKKQEVARKRIQEKLGIGDPENALQAISEFAPNIIGPGEFKGGAKAVEKVAEGFLPKLAKGTGKVAVETVLPFAQGGVKTRAAAAGLVVGLNEGADALDDHKDYNSIADAIDPNRGKMQPELAAKTFGDYLDPQSIEIYNHAVETGDVETQDQIREQVMALQQSDATEAMVPPAPAWETVEKEAALAALALAGMYTGSKVINRTKARLFQTSQLAGQAADRGITSGATKLNQAVVQNDQAVRDATAVATGDAKKLFGKSDELRKWESNFDAVSAPALNSKFDHFVSTGEIKDAVTTTDPIGPLLRAVATDLTPAERGLLTDGLLAASSLDDRIKTGVPTSFKSHRDGHQITDSELQQIVDAVNNSPKLSPYANAIRAQYRSMLDLMKEKGKLSQSQYDDWVKNRPNYVHMSKNEAEVPLDSLTGRGDPTRIPADARKGTMWSRNLEEGGGVKGGEAADPIVELSNQWAKTIKATAIDDVKKPWLEMASSHPVLGQVVKRLPMGVEPKVGADQLHTVWENGMPVHYVIKDKQIAEALDFTPFVNQSASSVLFSLPKRMFEFGTTGPGAPLFAPTSAMYDTVAGIINRPKGYDLGLINEFLNKVSKGKVKGLGGLDPTSWISAPIGTVRLAWDQTVHAMSDELAKQLTSGKGAVFDNLGPQGTQALQTRLAAMYSASVKGMMDEYGASNSSIFSSGSVSKLAPGLAQVAPEFATDAAVQAMRDAIKGDHTMAQKVLATSHVGFEAARANSLARVYTGLLRSIHEGFRYQAFATNLPKVFGDEDAMKIMASQTRRLAGDIGQAGSGKLTHMVTSNGAYVNVGIQSMAQFARMMKDNPATFLQNVSTSMLTLGALFLGYAAQSPENRAKIRAMSDDELSRIVPTFGGLPISIPAEVRPLMAPYIETLKAVSGISQVNPDGTDAFDPNIGRMVTRFLENDLSEEEAYARGDAFKSAVESSSPLNVGSFPAVNAMAAGLTNFDIGFTRYASKDGNTDPQAVRQQEIDPLGGDGRYIGDAVSARWMKVLENTAGAHVAGYARAAMDASRASEAGASDDRAAEIALSRLHDNWAKQSGPSAVLFQQYDKAHTPNTTAFKMFYAKKQGFEKAIEVMNQIMTPSTNGKDPATAMLSSLDPMDIERNMQLQGTQLLPIGSVAADIQKSIRGNDLDNRINQLKKQIDDVNNQRSTTIEERNRKLNELNEERQEYIDIVNNLYKAGEDIVRDRIGDPTFTWQGFAKNPKAYEKPLPTPAPTLEPGAPQAPQ